MKTETIKTVNLNRAVNMRSKVMLLTGHSEIEMNHMMFDFAVAYMKQMGMSEDWLAIWLQEPMFWGWWKQQWALIDEVFWYKYAGNQGREDVQDALRNRYNQLHMSLDKFPDDIVYEKIHSSYEVTSNAIIKKITSKHENL
jgi:hypothetical protein